MVQLVQHSSIQKASLHKPLPTIALAYVWPFLIIYPGFLYIYSTKYEELIGGEEWTKLFLGIIISIQILLWLMPYWNIEIQSIFKTSKCSSVKDATLIKIIPKSNSGSPAMVPIQREITNEGDLEIFFFFHKRRFVYDPISKSFSSPRYPIDLNPKIDFFLSNAGISDPSVEERMYGLNKFDIPVPTFLELFKEHAVAPFFVFQVFCVGLWCFSGNFFYSTFTLFMLVAFESTVVWQRQRTTLEFRSMGIKPYNVYVYRPNSSSSSSSDWIQLPSDQLLPNDLISIVRTKDESALPCDLLLINGSVIVNEAMLSGESTPLLKDSIALRDPNDIIDVEGLDKNSILFGGTKVLQVHSTSKYHISPPPPDNGVLAVVTKTGFETSQGSLVRTMIFSTEHVGVGNKEALWFILFLLIFAVAASWYVWKDGVKNDRSRSTLIVDCIQIITAVVPPELPMQLTLAVNSSLAILAKFAIFCIEPFRIPFAGRVDVCCFDKTGTLTREDLVVEGVATVSDPINSLKLSKANNLPQNTTLVLATAHALVRLDEGEIIGDPMERATLNAVEWNLGENDEIFPVKSPKSASAKVLRRFQFSSALKRSSVIARVSAYPSQHFISAKGAPETIRKMLTTVPDKYDSTYKYYMRNGSRVLALAYKLSPQISSSQLEHISREKVECDLIFAGFLIFNCPLKSDAVETIKMLNESSHRCVMITGDNPLTAAHVAREVKIVELEPLILDAYSDDIYDEHNKKNKTKTKANSWFTLLWHTVDDRVRIPWDHRERLDPSLYNQYDLCITGYALAKVVEAGIQSHIIELLKHTWVYARVSPAQKEYILISLKEAGYTTLMCGDGTNDVGALKQAHVGIALLNGTEDALKKIAESQKINRIKAMYDKQVDFVKKWNGQPPPVPAAIAHLYPPGIKNPHFADAVKAHGGTLTEKDIAAIKEANTASESSMVKGNASEGNKKQQNVEQAAASLADRLLESVEDEEPPQLKLGDASVAAPFTSKLQNVSAVTKIIRQGRCTLVATVQMYKILALNCLIQAYSLSVLYLTGMKNSDSQLTIAGILLSVCFLSISRARPVEQLSRERPQSNIFNIYVIGSILGQFAIHIVALMYITKEVYKLEPPVEFVDLFAEYSPTLLNTAIYLLQLSQNVSTFTVNYQGRPFREGIKENKGMYYGILGVTGLALSGSTELFPELNTALGLVPMSGQFKLVLTGSIIADYVACEIIERVLRALFMDYKPKDITQPKVYIQDIKKHM